MKVLFLCHRFPWPADGGGKIRALQTVKHLIAAGHSVTLCSLIRSAAEARGAEELAKQRARVVAVRVQPAVQHLRMALNILSSRPLSFGYFFSRRLQREITELLRTESFDLILVHCSSMGPYVHRVNGTATVMDFADMDSQKWRDYVRRKSVLTSPLYLLEAKRLEHWERVLAGRFDVCTTISANELQSLREICGEAAVRADWFPNGVDLEYFSPPAASSYDPDQIAFVGRMDYFPNAEAMQWFCRQVLPGLRSRRPGVKLKIIGANPPRSVRHLERLAGVEVTGFVQDVRPHLERAAVAVAPLRIARGMQNKVLECMAMGIPVVASPRVVAGLGIEADAPIRAAAHADDYVEQIVTILESSDLRARLSAASRDLVQRSFSWGSALAKLDCIVHELIDTPRGMLRSAGAEAHNQELA